jgi:hypothetical protein
MNFSLAYLKSNFDRMWGIVTHNDQHMDRELLLRVIDLAISLGMTGSEEVSDDLINGVRRSMEMEQRALSAQMRIQFPPIL